MRCENWDILMKFITIWEMMIMISIVEHTLQKDGKQPIDM